MGNPYRKWLPELKKKPKTTNGDQLSQKGNPYRKLLRELEKEPETTSGDQPSKKSNPYRKWLRPGLKKKPETAAENQTPSQPTSSETLGRVFRHPIAILSSRYTVHKKLGVGRYGVAWLVKDKCGNQFACKSIVINQLGIQGMQPDMIRNEVEILHHLTGHPNIANLKEVIEDAKHVHLIMELGRGGTLARRRPLFVTPSDKKESAFKKLFKSKPYPEKEAKEIFRHIAMAIRDCHDLGVIHRDVKPENLVFMTKKKGSPLKLIDFGFSTFFTAGETFERVHGTLPYVAPEVLDFKEISGPKADVWSAGVILYTLLCGVPPFWAETPHKLLEAIRQGNYNDYTTGPWRNISNSAKDLLRSMINEDQEARISAAQVLSHPWVIEAGAVYQAPRHVTIVRRMQQFEAMTKLKRVTMKVIAKKLPAEETEGLRNFFYSFKDVATTIDIALGEGLTYYELKNGLNKLDVDLLESEMDRLIHSVDMDEDSIIDQPEFIASTMHLNRIERHDRLFEAFNYFDRNKDGFITAEDMKQALQQSHVDDFDIKEIIAEVYEGGDRGICYNEFAGMMRK